MRPASPAESEISVGGAPSPLPHHHHTQHQLQQQQHQQSTLAHPSQHRSTIDLLQHQQILMQQHAAAAAAAAAAGLTRAGATAAEEYFQPLKRLRMSSEMEETALSNRTPSPVQTHSVTLPTTPTSTATTASSTVANVSAVNAVSTAVKSNIEGVKSFSIADILGHEKRATSTSPTPPSQQQQHAAGTPTRPLLNASSLLQPRAEPLDMVSAAAAAAAGMPHPMLLPGAQIVRPWDHLLGPMPVRPFIPSALLHYEQRLALDYHRQLQEHFNAQAQLLRHMGMDMIPSESGSERSSSAASDCCSPEIARSSGEPLASAGAQSMVMGERERDRDRERISHTSTSSNGGGNSLSGAGNGGSSGDNAATNGSGSKSKPNGTPLDALFQMTTKDFDESQGEFCKFMK